MVHFFCGWASFSFDFMILILSSVNIQRILEKKENGDKSFFGKKKMMGFCFF